MQSLNIIIRYLIKVAAIVPTNEMPLSETTGELEQRGQAAAAPRS